MMMNPTLKNHCPTLNRLLALPLLAAGLAAHAQSKDKGWTFGAVLDLTHTTRPLAAGLRDQGPQLGHSDLTAGGPLGQHLRGHIGAVVETHDGKLARPPACRPACSCAPAASRRRSAI
jgi:hypothetical protein